MKRLLITMALICAFFALPAHAQLFGTITDAPQHIVGAGGGCDGNKQCSGDAFFAEKLTGATYSISYVEIVPSFVTTYQQLGTSSNATTSVATRTLSVKPILSTGAEQVVAQSGRLSVAVGGVGGFALPSGSQPSVNFAVGEHLSVITRLNKNLNSDAGGANWYVALTGYFTQILGLQNGQTWAARVNLLHGSNGSK